MTVTTPWSDVWLSAEDWAEAFEAAEPGTPHNEARDQIWEELLAILLDKHVGDVSPTLLRKSLLQDEQLLTAFNRAWPLLEAADLVGDLWSVPAYLRRCAPWLGPEQVQALQRPEPQAWTVSDLPLLDAARQRLGDPEAARLRRRREAATAAERERMATVVDDLVDSDDSEMLVMSMLRGEDLQAPSSTRARCPTPTQTCSPVRSRTSSSTRRRSSPTRSGRCCCCAAPPAASPSSATGRRPGTGSPSRGRSGWHGSGSTASPWRP
jgi:hypothetical protein